MPKTDQKKISQGSANDGPTNRHRGVPAAVGSHKPGGNGPGKKKWAHEHDDRETRQ